MKFFLTASASLLAFAMFQMPTTPPIRMGLWESTATVKMSGMDMPLGIKMHDVTTKVHSCMTPESWQKNLSTSRNQKDCVRTNESMSGKTYSFDMTCKGNAVSHVSITFDSQESSHTTIQTTINPGNANSMKMDSSGEAHFLSSDCGKITPDKPEIVH